MKIQNLTGKNYDTILVEVKKIVEATERSDNIARKDGELLKYVIELFDSKNLLNEVREIYSKYYMFTEEVSDSLGISSKKHNVRGPFPLFDGAISDSKLNRWEMEKKKQLNDDDLISENFEEAVSKNYKYGYIVYDEMFGVKTFSELKFTSKALTKYEIDKILSQCCHGKKRCVNRIKLSDRSEKLYK